jgi:hypothetical protein
MIIAIDFDGTIVEHEFPEIGTEKQGAFEKIKQYQVLGHQVILWTCRNDEETKFPNRKLLTEAVEFCKLNGVVFDAVNSNVPDLGFNPLPKIYADLYIDDRAVKFTDWREH